MIRVGRSGTIRPMAALVAACLAATACNRSAAFDARAATVRLGRSADHLRIGGVSRPILDQPRGRVSIEVPAMDGCTLELAAAPAPATGVAPAKPRHCRASFDARTSSSPLVREFDIDDEHRWSEIHVALPTSSQGATLTLECEDPASVVWAQPLLLPSVSATSAPLIIVLSLDTLRADHVTGFGTPAIPTPSLAAIASEGIALTAAVSPYTWTEPAHFSLFYSRLYGFPPTTRPVAGLVSRLSDAGFATAGFTGGGFVGSDFHFHVGFDRYAEYTDPGKSDIDSFPGVLADAGQWIEDHKAAPSFVFLHTYAVHELPPSELENHGAGLFPPTVKVSPQELETAREFYGQLVGRVDAALAPFFAKLRTIADERATLLVVLSDHGEAFREHGNFRHGSSGSNVTLHDEVIHVPMMFWAPGIIPAKRVSTYPFSLLDVAPTLLAAVGLSAPPSMVGRDFWPLLHGQWGRVLARHRSGWDTPVVSYKDAGLDAPAAWSTRTAALKRIVNRPRKPGPQDVEIYDLATDPGERINLAARAPADTLATVVSELKEPLSRVEAGAPATGEALPVCPHCKWESFAAFWETVLPPREVKSGDGSAEPTLDPETRKRLQALGYLN